MNDASSSSDQPRLDLNSRDDIEPADPSSDDAGLVQQKQRAQQQQKAAFLDHLIRNVDIMIYAQLSVLYYMDCSFLNFVLRAFPHWFFFTPKSSIFPPPPPAHRLSIAVIFGHAILFALLHLLLSPPAAGEATRGYLHGGLLIDFVGQQSPVGRWRLVALDMMVLMLQILMLGIALERRAIKPGGAAGTSSEDTPNEPQQDHDSEERGVLRQGSEPTEGIELQDLHHTSSGRTGGDQDRERDELLAADTATVQAQQHPLDPFYTGEQVIANMHLLNTIRVQWQAGAVGVASSNIPAASGAQAAAVAAAAGRTLTYRFAEGIQRNP